MKRCLILIVFLIPVVLMAQPKKKSPRLNRLPRLYAADDERPAKTDVQYVPPIKQEDLDAFNSAIKSSEKITKTADISVKVGVEDRVSLMTGKSATTPSVKYGKTSVTKW